MMKSLKCYMGWHKWRMNRLPTLDDIHIADLLNWPTRQCKRCGLRQQWFRGGPEPWWDAKWVEVLEMDGQTR